MAARSWLSSAGGGSGLCASLLGHHIHRPRSRFSAVTSTERTTIVSSSMPKATAKPSSVRNVAGMVASTANVPARTNPAEVITPPVAASPIRAAPRVAFGRLFPHSSHQEDVVVDAECNEEHEHEQGERGVGPAEPEDVVEEECAHAEGGGEGKHHRGGQDQRRDKRAQQQAEDDEDYDEDERDDDLAVVGRHASSTGPHPSTSPRCPADSGPRRVAHGSAPPSPARPRPARSHGQPPSHPAAPTGHRVASRFLA
jgi:hypothetical protein